MEPVPCRQVFSPAFSLFEICPCSHSAQRMRQAHAVRPLTALLFSRLSVASSGALSTVSGTPATPSPSSTAPLLQGRLKPNTSPILSKALVVRAFASMAHGDYETVKVGTEDAVGTITLSRPKALNALNDKVSGCAEACLSAPHVTCLLAQQ